MNPEFPSLGHAVPCGYETMGWTSMTLRSCLVTRGQVKKSFTKRSLLATVLPEPTCCSSVVPTICGCGRSPTILHSKESTSIHLALVHSNLILAFMLTTF